MLSHRNFNYLRRSIPAAAPFFTNPQFLVNPDDEPSFGFVSSPLAIIPTWTSSICRTRQIPIRPKLGLLLPRPNGSAGRYRQSNTFHYKNNIFIHAVSGERFNRAWPL